MKIKTIARTEWRGIEGRACAYAPFEAFGLSGEAGLMRMTRVDKPLSVGAEGSEIYITGKGYEWLQLAPIGENFWFTVMFDASGRLFQYYIDITTETHALPNGRAWFKDGILDYVMTPNGEIVLLDSDELEDACKNSYITSAEHERIMRASERVFGLINGKEPFIRSECERVRLSLLPKLVY